MQGHPMKLQWVMQTSSSRKPSNWDAIISGSGRWQRHHCATKRRERWRARQYWCRTKITSLHAYKLIKRTIERRWIAAFPAACVEIQLMKHSRIQQQCATIWVTLYGLENKQSTLSILHLTSDNCACVYVCMCVFVRARFFLLWLVLFIDSIDLTISIHIYIYLLYFIWTFLFVLKIN